MRALLLPLAVVTICSNAAAQRDLLRETFDYPNGLEFATSYRSERAASEPGHYGIVNRGFHSDYTGAAPAGYFFDRTSGAAGGSLMMVNGSTTAGDVVWVRFVDLPVHTNVILTGWVANITLRSGINSSPANLAISINGQPVAEVAVDGAHGAWTRFTARWNSGADDFAAIMIQNTNTSAHGNDFALDDLSVTIGDGRVEPNAGAGSASAFTATFTHLGGNHYLGYLLLLPTPNIVFYTATGSCLIEYNKYSNGMRLIDDAGTGWLGGVSGIPLGTPGAALSNGQCTVDIARATAVVAGPVMTMTVPVTLKNALGPVLGTFLQTLDSTGAWGGMTQMGNWVIPGAPQTRQGPSVAAVSNTADGYVFTASHTAGAASLSMMHLLFSSSIVGAKGCHAIFFPGSNTANLVDDSGAALAANPSPVIGTPGVVLSNSRCALDVERMTSGTAGNIISTLFPMTFTAMPSTWNVYANAFDNAGLLSHWVLAGAQ